MVEIDALAELLEFLPFDSTFAALIETEHVEIASVGKMAKLAE
jgi:hypothetical protein